MTTERDLIQRLADALNEWQLGNAPPEDTYDVDLINEADAYLAQPEPEGPTVMEIIELADEIEAEGLGQVDLVRRALARWGRLAVESEPEALTDEEILKISDQFDIDGIEDVTKGMPLDTFWDSYQPQQRIAFARAIIAADRARYGRPAIKPVPVSERPWERDGWCDGDGWCWVWNAGNCHWWEWIDSALISFAQDDYTHSLPHYALIVPAAHWRL